MVIIGTTKDPDSHFILIKKYPFHAVITHVGCLKKSSWSGFLWKIYQFSGKTANILSYTFTFNNLLCKIFSHCFFPLVFCALGDPLSPHPLPVFSWVGVLILKILVILSWKTLGAVSMTDNCWVLPLQLSIYWIKLNKLPAVKAKHNSSELFVNTIFLWASITFL